MSNYIYRTAEKTDFHRILKFLADYFYHEEPSIKATQTSLEEWLPIFGEMVESSLIMPLSIIVTTENEDTVVGCLLNSVWKREEDERKKQDTGKSADHDIEGFSEVMQRFLTVLQKCHNEFWDLAPSDINTVVYREISSVGAPWQRQGIASKMLIRSNEEARIQGIDGIVSATSSYANQVLLAKNGFECLKEFPYSSIVNDNGHRLVEPADGSKGMRVNFKRIIRLRIPFEPLLSQFQFYTLLYVLKPNSSHNRPHRRNQYKAAEYGNFTGSNTIRTATWCIDRKLEAKWRISRRIRNFFFQEKSQPVDYDTTYEERAFWECMEAC